MQIEFFRSKKNVIEKYSALVLLDESKIDSEANYGMTMSEDVSFHCVCHPLQHDQCLPDDSCSLVSFKDLPVDHRLAVIRQIASDLREYPDLFGAEDLPDDMRAPIMDTIAWFISSGAGARADSEALKHMLSAMTSIVPEQDELFIS